MRTHNASFHCCAHAKAQKSRSIHTRTHVHTPLLQFFIILIFLSHAVQTHTHTQMRNVSIYLMINRYRASERQQIIKRRRERERERERDRKKERERKRMVGWLVEWLDFCSFVLLMGETNKTPSGLCRFPCWDEMTTVIDSRPRDEVIFRVLLLCSPVTWFQSSSFQ